MILTIYIPTEEDLKKWVTEAVRDSLGDGRKINLADGDRDEPLLNRKEAAASLQVSLVTLGRWVKDGLPCRRQGGRVYFLKSEVMEHLKKQGSRQFVFKELLE